MSDQPQPQRQDDPSAEPVEDLAPGEESQDVAGGKQATEPVEPGLLPAV